MAWRLLDPHRREHKAEISALSRVELKNVPNRRSWFAWSKYFTDEEKRHFSVFKLTLENNSEIHGLIALEVRQGCVYIDLLEVAPHSRRKPLPNRRYINLSDVMFAFATKFSIDHDQDGYLALVPKTGLQNHYRERYRARPVGPHLYMIEPIVTPGLIRLYYV